MFGQKSRTDSVDTQYFCHCGGVDVFEPLLRHEARSLVQNARCDNDKVDGTVAPTLLGRDRHRDLVRNVDGNGVYTRLTGIDWLSR